MKIRTVICADEAMILTDGEIYGKAIFLAENESIEDYPEIPEQEYEKIMAEKEKV